MLNCFVSETLRVFVNLKKVFVIKFLLLLIVCLCFARERET